MNTAGTSFLNSTGVLKRRSFSFGYFCVLYFNWVLNVWPKESLNSADVGMTCFRVQIRTSVLLRFQKEKVAVIADIQQMFHCFLENKDHNFLCFL